MNACNYLDPWKKCSFKNCSFLKRGSLFARNSKNGFAAYDKLITVKKKLYPKIPPRPNFYLLYAGVHPIRDYDYSLDFWHTKKCPKSSQTIINAELNDFCHFHRKLYKSSFLIGILYQKSSFDLGCFSLDS